MAFRQTTFDPSVSQQYQRGGHGIPGLEQPAKTSVNMMEMEERLAKELAKMRIDDERK